MNARYSDDLHYTVVTFDIQITPVCCEIKGSSVKERFVITVGRQCWFDVQFPIAYIAKLQIKYKSKYIKHDHSLILNINFESFIFTYFLGDYHSIGTRYCLPSIQ